MSIYDLAKEIFTEEEREKRSDFDIRYIVSQNLTQSEITDRKGRISPSSGCSLCPRQAYLHGVKPYSNIWDVTSEFYAKIGIEIENIVARGLGGYLVKQDIRLWENEELRLGAALDLLIKNYDNQLVIAEVKSCGDLPSSPKIYQYWQMVLYKSYYCCDGMMIYVSRGVMDNKRQLKLKQFDSPFDYDEARKAIVNSYISRASLDKVKMPFKGDLISKISDCGFCSFTDICWNGKDSGHKELSSKEYLVIVNKANRYADKFFSREELKVRRLDMYEKIKENNPKISQIDFLNMFRYEGID